MPDTEPRAVIDHLLDDHQRVAGLARLLEPFLDRDAPPVEPDFARLRWTLLREFTRHHAVERGLLLRAGRAGAAPVGHDQGLAAALNAHMTEWTGAAIIDRWPRYRAAARALLARLRRQMEHEETVLFPMLRG